MPDLSSPDHKHLSLVWDKICQDSPLSKWRWRWNSEVQQPERINKKYTDHIKRDQNRWVLCRLGGKPPREIILTNDVIDRFLLEWKRKGSAGNESFICKWMCAKEGINRPALRQLVAAAATLPSTRPAVHLPPQWTSGLRVEPSFKALPTRISPLIAPPHALPVQSAADTIAQAKQIIFITGAGISTAAGIPDYRSWDGLFKSRTLFGQAIEGLEVFNYRASFATQQGQDIHRYAMGTLAEIAQRSTPTIWHHMLAFLAEHRQVRLRRHYTQNIDALETSFKALRTPTPMVSHAYQNLNIQLHGNLRFEKCPECKTFTELDPQHYIHNVDLQCWQCRTRFPQETSKRKHKIPDLRPHVVLYDEPTSTDLELKERIGVIKKDINDLRRNSSIDLLVVAGTSASLQEIQSMIHEFHQAMKERDGTAGICVWINREAPRPILRPYFDHIYEVNCEDVAEAFFQQVDWSMLHRKPD